MIFAKLAILSQTISVDMMSYIAAIYTVVKAKGQNSTTGNRKKSCCFQSRYIESCIFCGDLLCMFFIPTLLTYFVHNC